MKTELSDSELLNLTKIADEYIYEGVFRHHLSSAGVLEIIRAYEEIIKKKEQSH